MMQRIWHEEDGHRVKVWARVVQVRTRHTRHPGGCGRHRALHRGVYTSR